ncbi:MAG TPA: polysialyltransferase family glycosyltransferase [Flavisolibacter sp.]
MDVRKKKILLCWGYNRKGWIAPFEALKDKLDFVYLYYRFPGEEEACYTDCDRIYWYDYKSGFDILDDVKPDAVIFMSLTSGFPIALNAACKTRNVLTYIFQHGLFRTYKEYRAIEEADRKARKSNQVSSNDNSSNDEEINGKSTLRFLLSSFTGKYYFSILPVFIYFSVLKRRGLYYASYHLPLDVRKPSRYICYTPRNATIYREMDKIGEDKIDYTGIPELDVFFQDHSPVEEQDYFLLIDQPFAENRYYDFGVSKEQMNGFYEKLNTYCRSVNCRLKIKLHPESYKSTWLFSDDNIDYIQDANMVPLIKNAKGVFGTTSTLMLPAIFFKPCFLLLIHDSSFQKDMLEMGLANGADFFEFRPADIIFKKEVNSQHKHKFVYSYLFKTDGQSVERLRQILERTHEL